MKNKFIVVIPDLPNGHICLRCAGKKRRSAKPGAIKLHIAKCQVCKNRKYGMILDRYERQGES